MGEAKNVLLLAGDADVLIIFGCNCMYLSLVTGGKKNISGPPQVSF